MQIKCFECESPVAAADVDGVVEAFLAHGREQHRWTYPEDALRNYARNCAEALERLTGATERQPTIGEVTVEAMSEARVDDWLGFFDHDGFADNPDWASCYCLEPHLPASAQEPERPWRRTRAMMAERLRSGATFGYLAYVEGRPVGWVNASLRSDYVLYLLVDPDGPAARSVIGVSCFVIAPPFRRHAVAAALLDRVILDAGTRGARWVEGYPHNVPRPGDAGHFRGPRAMYEARGFRAIEVKEKYTVMRRGVP